MVLPLGVSATPKRRPGRLPAQPAAGQILGKKEPPTTRKRKMAFYKQNRGATGVKWENRRDSVGHPTDISKWNKCSNPSTVSSSHRVNNPHRQRQYTAGLEIRPRASPKIIFTSWSNDGSCQEVKPPISSAEELQVPSAHASC